MNRRALLRGIAAVTMAWGPLAIRRRPDVEDDLAFLGDPMPVRKGLTELLSDIGFHPVGRAIDADLPYGDLDFRSPIATEVRIVVTPPENPS